VGKVKLAYLDPPFNTQQAFEHYDDALEHSVWLTMMRDRLLQIRKLLSPDGPVWVHCDDSEQAYLKVMMDEVFGRSNFIATVIWEKTFSIKSSARHLSIDQDYVVIYARNADTWRPTLLPRTEEADARYANPDNDPRGRWTSGPLQARNYYAQGRYEVVSPQGNRLRPPPGTYWRFSETRFLELDDDQRIWWGADGTNFPRLKRFLSEIREGIVPRTIWRREDVGDTAEANRELRRLEL
jgi:adenine-specific DNA-methyltransferase